MFYKFIYRVFSRLEQANLASSCLISTAAATFLSSLVDEVIHPGRSITRGSVLAIGAKFFIKQEALKNSVRGEGEDTHEDGSHQVANYAGDDAGEVGWGDCLGGFGPFGQHEVANDDGESHDEELAYEHEDAANWASHTKSERILDNEHESIEGWSAEVLASKGYLDVCVLSNELDTSFEAVEQIGSGTEDALY